VVLSHATRRGPTASAASPFLADLDPALLDRQAGRPGQRPRRRSAGHQLRLL
jgi:hypothetical protein